MISLYLQAVLLVLAVLKEIRNRHGPVYEIKIRIAGVSQKMFNFSPSRNAAATTAPIILAHTSPHSLRAAQRTGIKGQPVVVRSINLLNSFVHSP